MIDKSSFSVLILISLIFLKPLKAQEEIKMTLPSSPAFSILGFEPSSVMKPTSNKDLGSDLLSAFDKDGKLLMNLGMEVSPYWLKSRSVLTRKEYFDPSVGQCFIQSLNISSATVKDSVKGDNKLGAGLRFKLINGRPTDEYIEIEKKLNVQLTLSAVVGACIANVGTEIHSKDSAMEILMSSLTELGYSKDVISLFKENCKEILGEFDDTNEGIKNFLKALNEKVIGSNGALIKQVAELSKKRVGFILEIAAASSFITTKKNEPIDRAGVWVNASNYFSPSNSWTITGRYMFASWDSAMTNTDIGLSYLKEMSGFNISIEAMFRWYRADVMDININNQVITRVEKGNTYRISAQGSYKLAENISVNISLGKDFDSPFTTTVSYFSVFGINYSLFKPQKVDLAKNK